MYHKSIDYRRHQRKYHIEHKQHIALACWRNYLMSPDEVMVLGKLDKGKIHCSCYICSGSDKTKNTGHKISERRKLLREKDDIEEYFELKK